MIISGLKTQYMENLLGLGNARPLFSYLLTADRQGAYQSAYINGREVADTLFAPGESDASETVYYVTYDVTEMIKEGQNTLGVILGNGQYAGFTVNPV